MARLFNQQEVRGSSASVDVEPSDTFTYVGFSSANQSKNFKLYDIDLVKQDLINHFYIRKGEKLENPNFGSIIWEMLFEPFTESARQIISDDVEQIINYDPRIQVETVSVDSIESGIRIEATVRYLPFNVVEQMQFTFDRENSIII